MRQVAEILVADGSSAPPLELGIPSTKRREAALRRLKRILDCNYMQAEKLLTSSALTHEHGEKSYAHALALGKYFKQGGAQVQDAAEAHRIHLRERLQKLGYSVYQVDLALADLEATLGVLNVTSLEVQGWLHRQAVAYDENQERDENWRRRALEKQAQLLAAAKPPIVGQGDVKQPHLHKADTLLREHGMNDAAAVLQQAASTSSSSTKNPNGPAPVQDSGSKALLDTVSKKGRMKIHIGTSHLLLSNSFSPVQTCSCKYRRSAP